MTLDCSPMWLSIRSISASFSIELRRSISPGLRAWTSSMKSLCKTPRSTSSGHPPIAHARMSGPDSLHARDELHLLQALPWKTDNEGIELALRERREGLRRHRARPSEAALVQAPCRAPDAEAVMYEQLDARGTRVGEEVAVVGLCSTEDLHYAHQQPVGASSHVDRLDGEPHGVDADHRSSSRIQTAHSVAAVAGHVPTASGAPRGTPERMSPGCAGGDGGVRLRTE